MDPQLKADYLAALRSGRYEQIRKVLRIGPMKFSALGVLANTIDPYAWQIDGQVLFGTHWYWRDCGVVCFINGSVPEVSKQEARELHNMNDFGAYNFVRIANYVEQNFGLFGGSNEAT